MPLPLRLTCLLCAAHASLKQPVSVSKVVDAHPRRRLVGEDYTNVGEPSRCKSTEYFDTTAVSCRSCTEKVSLAFLGDVSNRVPDTSNTGPNGVPLSCKCRTGFQKQLQCASTREV